ncbi:phage tail tape measure protein [Spartinivicinus poritis]|uniref:Phage tail tape measure protein n=1 Tax=Spartinivicinus poritis TaxID=2994640 RepID=A0ABT5UKN4_9GAMM|nr:phage tail tape measure protein [Spartinivicinus sp. A2-2]MDE1465599.1 phage tail tape measure protein [Spartinivicinus sp. A2-2]
MPSLGVSIVLSLTSHIASPAAAASQSIARLETRYQALSRAQQQLNRNMERRSALRGQLMDAAALGLGLAVPIKEAIQFESAMADVKKVVDFKQPEGFEKLSDTLKKLTRTIPVTATGLAEIAASGGQLGIGEQDLPQFVKTVAKMSTAFDMLPSEAGDAMAKLSNIYKIPISQMTQLGDVINHLSDNSAAKAKDMVSTLSRIGGTARQFGLASHQAAALSNAFIALGKEPEVAGTAINAMLQKLQNASGQTKAFSKALDKIGYSAHDLEYAIAQDAQGALLDFLSTLEGVDKQKRAGILADLFGMEFSDDVSLLVGSLDTYRKAIGHVGDQAKYTGSMQAEFESRSKTTAANLILMRNGLTEVAINLGTILLPPLNKIINHIRELTVKITEFAKEHPAVTKALVSIAAVLVMGKVAAIGCGYAWTFFRGGILTGVVALNRGRLALMLYNRHLSAHRRLTILSQITGLSRAEVMNRRFTRSLVAGRGVVRSMGAAMWGAATGGLKALLLGLKALTVGLLTTPIGWIIIAITAAGVAIYKYWDHVKAFIGGVVEGFSAAFGPIKETLAPLEPIFSGISDAVGWVVDAISDLFTPVNATAEELDSAASMGRRFGEALAGAVKIILTPFTKLLETIQAVRDNMDIITKTPGKVPGMVMDKIKNKVSSDIQGVKKVWNWAFGDDEEEQPETIKKQQVKP